VPHGRYRPLPSLLAPSPGPVPCKCRQRYTHRSLWSRRRRRLWCFAPTGCIRLTVDRRRCVYCRVTADESAARNAVYCEGAETSAYAPDQRDSHVLLSRNSLLHFRKFAFYAVFVWMCEVPRGHLPQLSGEYTIMRSGDSINTPNFVPCILHQICLWTKLMFDPGYNLQI